MSMSASSLLAANSTNFDLAKIETAVYCVLLIPTLMVVFMQLSRGSRPGGWIHLVLYVGIQLVGSIIILVSGEDTVSTIGNILAQIGLGPLMMSVKSNITNCAKETELEHHFLFGRVIGLLFHLLVFAGALTQAFGYDKLFGGDASEYNTAMDMIKAGCALYIIAWVWMIITNVAALTGFRDMAATRKLLIACTLSVPIFLVRIVYTAISDFDPSNTDFGITSTNLTLKVAMDFLPLIIVLVFMDLGGFLSWIDGKKNGGQKQNGQQPMGQMPAYSSSAPPPGPYSQF